MLQDWQARAGQGDPWVRSLRIDSATFLGAQAWFLAHTSQDCKHVLDEKWTRFCAWARNIDPSAPHEKRIVGIVLGKGDPHLFVTRNRNARPEECKLLYLPASAGR